MSDHEHAAGAERGAEPGVRAYLVVTAILLLLLMIFGLLMRLGQAKLLPFSPAWFYKLMTLHGAGMVGLAGLAGVAILWHFLGRYVALSGRIFVANLILFLVGVGMILYGVLIGNFQGGWTFLYPLPGTSMGAWSTSAAAFFLGGLLTLGVGFLLLFLDVARAVIARYGSLAGGLGWPQLFAGRTGDTPPPTVVAGTMVAIIDLLALPVGAAILAMMLVNLFRPEFQIDPRLAKGMTYFFGHVFINSTIYMAVVAVYEILPRYTQRPWKTSKVFLAAWTASTAIVLFIFPHHLLMDFAYPTWMLAMGHVLGYFNALPILLVTGYGALTIVYRSGIRWDSASRLLFVSMLGWAAGVLPAFIDGTIPVNYVMHNTLWVPGHFHTYLLLGFVAIVFGVMSYLGKPGPEAEDGLPDRTAFWVFTVGTIGFVLAFLYAGKEGVVRRYADHLPAWIPYDRIGSFFAVLVVASAMYFLFRFLGDLRTVGREHVRAGLLRTGSVES